MPNTESQASPATDPDDGQDLDPTTDRELAAQFAMFSGQAVDFQNQMTGDQLSRLTYSDKMADAQHMALIAIYHELRHGHDQAARPVTAGPDGGVWVLVLEREDDVRYVRGDQIVEVQRVGPPAAQPHADGKPRPWEGANRYRVEATVADPEGRHRVVLWELPDHATAAAAARTLLALLSSDRAGVVLLSDDNRVELVPLEELGDQS